MDLADELSVAALKQLFRVHRRLILGTGVLMAAIAGAVALSRPTLYRSSASFAPRSGKSSSTAVSGLAAQFGVSVPGGDPADSPQFYADLLHSRTIMDTVLSRAYQVTREGRTESVTLSQLLAPKYTGRAQLLEARKVLLKRTAIDVNAKTSVVTISVAAPNPGLAQAIASGLLQAANAFTLEGRQSRAHQERLFTEARAAEARTELANAEGALESFLSANRASSAPRLEFAQDRLRRQVAMRQQLYTALAQAADQSRIEELRDTPSLAIVEEPELPVEAESRGVVTLPLLGLVFGTLLGFFLAFALEMVRGDAGAPADVASHRSRAPAPGREVQPA